MEFLKSLTSHQAHDLIASFPLPAPATRTVALKEALGEVLAEDVVAQESLPPLPRSLVDGYALRAQDVYGAKETMPSFLQVLGEVLIGERPLQAVTPAGAIAVATGAIVPEGADGIVMEEHVRRSPGIVEVTRPVRKGENICFPGEDISRGSTALDRGRRLGPFDTGVLAALGIARVPVFRKPRIALISSGNEIVEVEEKKSEAQARDINRYTVSHLLSRQGCHSEFLGIARDTAEDVMQKLSAGRDCDLILISAGSSKGSGDLISTAIDRLEGEILFHGINIKPGKPTLFARLFGKPLFGLPGHPVSCAMVLIRFVFPLLRRMKGEKETTQPRLPGTLSTNIPSAYGIEEYVRVKVTFVDKDISVEPLFAKSSVISLLSKADGYVIVPEGREGLEQGEGVEVYLFG